MRDFEKVCPIAVVQAAPVMFDAAASAEKAARLIDEAAEHGAKLIVFPELFIPGYPYGLTFGFTVGHRDENMRPDWARYAANSVLVPGAELDLLTGLGNGFDTSNDARRPLLVGGGVGVPPLYKLAKALLAEGKPVSVVLGFNTADEVFYADEFRALGCDVHVATADGSAGTKGFVTTAIAGDGIDFDYFYACGPLPMLRALCDSVAQDGQLSFEERMGCGFGACMGCSCKTKYGNKRICKEGPVLTKGEIIW